MAGGERPLCDETGAVGCCDVGPDAAAPAMLVVTDDATVLVVAISASVKALDESDIMRVLVAVPAEVEALIVDDEDEVPLVLPICAIVK